MERPRGNGSEVSQRLNETALYMELTTIVRRINRRRIKEATEIERMRIRELQGMLRELRRGVGGEIQAENVGNDA